MLKKDAAARPTIDEILDQEFVHKRLHAQVLARTNNLRNKEGDGGASMNGASGKKPVPTTSGKLNGPDASSSRPGTGIRVDTREANAANANEIVDPLSSLTPRQRVILKKQRRKYVCLRTMFNPACLLHSFTLPTLELPCWTRI